MTNAGHIANPTNVDQPPASEAGRGHFEPGALKRRALRGSAWMLSGHGTQQILRLGGNLILTRLLLTEHFGLMAIVLVFVQGLQMFSDMGIGPALVRDVRGEERIFRRTAFTMQIIRGLILWGIACALAWPMAILYDEPMLAQLIPVASLGAVILGFESTRTRMAKRHLLLGRLNVLNVFAYAIGLVVMVALALIYRSVWALVIGGLVATTLRVIMGHVFLPGMRDGIGWDHDCFIAIYRFGRVILGSSAVFFISSQLGTLLLGIYIGMASLGVYSIAWMISRVAVQTNQSLSRGVGLPALSRIVREQPHRIREVYYRTRRSLDWLFLPILGVGIGCGTLVIALLYDPRWIEAGWMLQILLFWPAMRTMLEPGESCLVAMGHPRFALIQNVARFAWMIVAIPLGWYLFGLVGVVCAVAMGEVPAAVVIWYGKHKYGVLDMRREAHAWLKLLAGVAVGATIMIAMSH